MLLILLTAFVLGAVHAIAPDHLAAVGVFVSRARSAREALGHGARWGVGHALTLTLAGFAVLFVADEWPALLSLRAEWLVGVVLVGLGARTCWRAWQWDEGLTPHHVVHRHEDGSTHAHRHPLLGIGMLHGLAGSGAMAALVPLTAGRNPWHAVLWLLLFGVGTIAAMALIAAAAGWSLQWSAQKSIRAMRHIVGASGAVSVGVGVMWLVQAT